MIFTFNRLNKFTSILFIIVLVFNFQGYNWTLTFLEQKSVKRLEQSIDAGQYDISQLVEIKIPLNLPYYTDWGEYKTYYGQVELNGENYQFVKRKIVSDTLYLLCIAQTEKNRIQKAKTDYFMMSNNFSGNRQHNQNKSTSIKLMLGKFLIKQNPLVIDIHPLMIAGHVNRNISWSSQFKLCIFSPPPEC